MKIRNGFVSNSSSSSFVIMKEHLTPGQLDMIRNHSDWMTEYVKTKGKWLESCGFYDCGRYGFFEENGDRWKIHETETTIMGGTVIDNFQMLEYLEHEVGVPSDHVESEDHWFSDWSNWDEERNL